MEHIFIWAGVILVLLIIIYLLMRWYHYQKMTQTIKTIFDNLNTDYVLEAKQSGDYHWRIETKDNIIFCKLFHLQRNDHLVITNPTTWIRTKKSEPIKIENRLLGVTRFLNSKSLDANKPIHHVAILHPAPLQIRQYINENEMIIIDGLQKVYDYYFFTQETLSEGFQMLIHMDKQ